MWNTFHRIDCSYATLAQSYLRNTTLSNVVASCTKEEVVSLHFIMAVIVSFVVNLFFRNKY